MRWAFNAVFTYVTYGSTVCFGLVGRRNASRRVSHVSRLHGMNEH